MNKPKKPLNVSYSKLSTYNQCPYKYKLQYKDYIIPEYIPSPFFVGTALDEASSVILKSKMKGTEYEEFSYIKMIEVFTRFMTEYKFQLEDIYLPTSHLPKYAKSDMSLELLDIDDINDIEIFMSERGIDSPIMEFIENMYSAMKKGRHNVTQSDLEVYNYIIWLSLFTRGKMMLDTLKTWIDDNVEEVHSIQRKFKITNEEGDNLNGAMDIECTMKDGIKRVLDLKTAAQPKATYPDNIVETAMQLHIYSQESVPQVGYVILDKSVRVKEPRIRIRYVEGEVNEVMLDNTFEFIEDTMNKIKNEEFPKNEESCFLMGKCDYIGLCKYNSMKGLVKRKFEDKKPIDKKD